jgi:hypothetical protein
VERLLQPEIDYGYIGPGHMFPRLDGIFLGSTFDPNDWSLALNPEHSKRILNTHTDIVKGGLIRTVPAAAFEQG